MYKMAEQARTQEIVQRKITPIEANRVFSPAVPDQRVGEDTSIGVTVSSRTEAHESHRSCR